MTQRPLIRSGGLSGRIFAITSYNKFSDGRVEAKQKFDVTEDVLAALPGSVRIWWCADQMSGGSDQFAICGVHSGLGCGWRRLVAG